MIKLNMTKIYIFVNVFAGLFISNVGHAADLAATTTSVNASLTVITALSLGKIFTYFMVMLGPIKLVAPFAKISKGMDARTTRTLAIKGFVIACVAGLVAAFIGTSTLNSWGVSIPALLLAAGLVLLLVALKSVIAQYESQPTPVAEKPEPATMASTALALSPLAFPNIITPYGIAALILLLAVADPSYSVEIFGVFFAVMVINLIVMIFAKPIIKYGAAVLSVLGAVLGVLQVALAMQMLLLAFRMLHIIPPFVA